MDIEVISEDSNITNSEWNHPKLKFMLEEYRNVNEQILLWLKTDEDDFKNNLIFTGAFAAAVGYIKTNEIPHLFFIICFPLWVTIWSQFRRGRIIMSLHDYLRKEIIEKFNKEFNYGSRDNLTSWQETIPKYIYEDLDIMGPPILGRGLVPFMLIIISNYFFFEGKYDFDTFSQILFSLNLIMFLIFCFSVRTFILSGKERQKKVMESGIKSRSIILKIYYSVSKFIRWLLYLK